jgi:hypothetical protein
VDVFQHVEADDGVELPARRPALLEVDGVYGEPAPLAPPLRERQKRLRDVSQGDPAAY